MITLYIVKSIDTSKTHQYLRAVMPSMSADYAHFYFNGASQREAHRFVFIGDAKAVAKRLGGKVFRLKPRAK